MLRAIGYHLEGLLIDHARALRILHRQLFEDRVVDPEVDVAPPCPLLRRQRLSLGLGLVSLGLGR